ncbi:MAG TPA: nucleotide exchange factor GrpE [Kofleriaceae bacterium]|jgi:molecular chaperone GrpE|nr:nucleotide exchange factor GrpE [Kofleriaceae bacterium]
MKRMAEVSPTEEPRPLDEEAVAEDRARLARALQDLEAAKARVERDARAVHEETRAKLVSEMLPVLDNFDRAIAVAESSGDAPSVVEGMRMIHRQLERVLEGYGLVRFDAVGAAFDPQLHDAMTMIAVGDPGQDRMVVAQHEPGYMFGDRLLRAAKVVVGKHA